WKTPGEVKFQFLRLSSRRRESLPEKPRDRGPAGLKIYFSPIATPQFHEEAHDIGISGYPAPRFGPPAAAVLARRAGGRLHLRLRAGAGERAGRDRRRRHRAADATGD